MEKTELKSIVESILGLSGKMVCFSKGRYSFYNPRNIVVFNSNICTKEDGKIWYGDFDITINHKKLIKLSKSLKKEIYVLYETDARFENEDSPLFEKYVAKVDGDHIAFSHEDVIYNKNKPMYPEEKVIVNANDCEDYPPENKDDYDLIFSVNPKEIKKNENPLSFIQEKLIKKIGKKKAQKIWTSLHWSYDTDKEHEKKLRLYIKNKMKIKDEYTIHKMICISSLDSPLVFNKQTAWAKKWAFYLKKTKSMLKTQI